MEFRDPMLTGDVSVVVSELLVATAESSDPLLDDSVSQVLKLLRQRMNMDVVFVSEIVDGRRMFRFVDARPGAPDVRAGASNPVEESVCQRIVDGRLPEMIPDVDALPKEQLPPMPFRVGAHLSTPILLQGGRTYGTLCCFSTAANPRLRDEDLKTLRLCATLVSKKLELAQVRGIVEPPPDWQLEPMAETYESKIWAAPARRRR
jgi:GAF domain-containing protein